MAGSKRNQVLCSQCFLLPALSMEWFCRKFHSMPSPKGSLPALEGFVQAECEFRARERIPALKITPTRGCVWVSARVPVSVCTCGEVCARGVGSGAATRALGEAGAEGGRPLRPLPLGPPRFAGILAAPPGARRGGATGP